MGFQKNTLAYDLKKQNFQIAIPNDLFLTIWFDKLALLIYEIAISNAHWIKRNFPNPIWGKKNKKKLSQVLIRHFLVTSSLLPTHQLNCIKVIKKMELKQSPTTTRRGKEMESIGITFNEVDGSYEMIRIPNISGIMS
jgi:hypothetical protein